MAFVFAQLALKRRAIDIPQGAFHLIARASAYGKTAEAQTTSWILYGAANDTRTGVVSGPSLSSGTVSSREEIPP
jgi:hypothetical protein